MHMDAMHHQALKCVSPRLVPRMSQLYVCATLQDIRASARLCVSGKHVVGVMRSPSPVNVNVFGHQEK